MTLKRFLRCGLDKIGAILKRFTLTFTKPQLVFLVGKMLGTSVAFLK